MISILQTETAHRYKPKSAAKHSTEGHNRTLSTSITREKGPIVPKETAMTSVTDKLKTFSVASVNSLFSRLSESSFPDELIPLKIGTDRRFLTKIGDICCTFRTFLGALVNKGRGYCYRICLVLNIFLVCFVDVCEMSSFVGCRKSL